MSLLIVVGNLVFGTILVLFAVAEFSDYKTNSHLVAVLFVQAAVQLVLLALGFVARSGRSSLRWARSWLGGAFLGLLSISTTAALLAWANGMS
jgi:hypothetical protein